MPIVGCTFKAGTSFIFNSKPYFRVFHHLPSWPKEVVMVSTPKMYPRSGYFLVIHIFLQCFLYLQYHQEWFKSIRTEVTISWRVSTSLAWQIMSTPNRPSIFIMGTEQIGNVYLHFYFQLRDHSNIT